MSKKKFNPSDFLKSDSPLPKITTATVFPVDDVEEITRRVEAAAVDIAPNYNDWCELGFALADAKGEAGREIFRRLSRFHPGVTDAGIDKQFTACLRSHGNGVHIQTFFHLAKSAGVSLAVARSIQNAKMPIVPLGTIDTLAQSALLEEKDPEPLPTFSQSVRDCLPSILDNVIKNAFSEEDADLLLLGAVTAMSACLPNIYGVYDGRTVFPNLYLFVTAQASAGKGRLSLCQILVQPIHRERIEIYARAMEQYKQDEQEYIINKKDPDAQKPELPPQKMLFIPANCSSTAFYQALSENDEFGLIFETEGDTLANTFKADYGNYSDGFRKAFHHERIEYMRRANAERKTIERPRLSAVLSGTPAQILSLIPTAENGLFSRFMFYFMNIKIEWRDVFAQSDGSPLDEVFAKIANQFYELYRFLRDFQQPIRFDFSQSQRQQFNQHFDAIQEQYNTLFGVDIVASVRRLGLSTFRFALVISALRLFDTGEASPVLVCNDDDFKTAIAVSSVLIRHAAQIFDLLPQDNNVKKEPDPQELPFKQQFYQALPPQFENKEAIALAAAKGIAKRTCARWLKDWWLAGQLEKEARGLYKKTNSKS